MAGLKPGVAYALAAVLVCSATVVWLVRRAPPGPPPGPSKEQLALEAGERLARQAAAYDWERSKRNLELIGAEIQRERRKHRLKPVSEWRTLKDTGVESLYTIQIRTPEQWRWTDDTLRVRDMGTSKSVTQYMTLFDLMDDRLSPAELESVLTSRGESLPVMYDDSMYALRDLSVYRQPVEVLVLRLNGMVERVRYFTPGLPNEPGFKERYTRM